MRRLILLTWLALASPAAARSLETAVQNACLTHPSISSSSIQVARSQQSIHEARSVLFPRVDSSTQVGIADDGDETNLLQGGVGPLSNSRPFSTRLSLNQPIYLGGRGRAGIESAKIRRDIDRYRLQSSIIELQIETISAYLDLGRAAARAEVQRSNVASLRDQLRNARRRLELGAGTRSDVVQAEARIGQGEAGVTDAQNRIRVSFIRLREASGLQKTQDVSLPEIPNVPTSLETGLSLAATHNPAARIALLQILDAEQATRSVKGERAPDIRLVGNLDIQRDTAFNGFERDEGSLNIAVNIPLFAGGGLASRERSAKLGESFQFSERDRILRELAQAVETEWYSFNAAKDLIGINEKLVDAASQALDSVRREVEAGFRPNVDLLNAQQEVLAAKLALTDSEFDAVLSAYRYLAVTGTIGDGRFAACKDVQGELPHLERQESPEEAGSRWIPWLPIAPAAPTDRRGPRARR